jgi:putative methyltransferase (TIGR04325 family)
MSLRRTAKYILPPIIVDAARHLLRNGSHRESHETRPEWEYMPDGWHTKDPHIAGWNTQSIVATQKAKWPAFQRLLQGTDTLGIAHEAPTPSNDDFASHNILMSYAFVLAMTARHRDCVSLLDWGGGIGHYYAISKALVPEVAIRYSCKDFSLFCECGRELLPEATFYDNEEECLRQTYDLVFASSSLHYSQDWRATLTRLASVSRSYLFVTRLPITYEAPSFVMVQRPYRYGYHTEYLSWSLNRAEFLRHARSLRLNLIREFLVYPGKPHVVNAPEQPNYRGFLFRSDTRT